MRRLLTLLLSVLVSAAIAPAAEAPTRGLSLVVTPACCAITFTAYALGILPIEGRFTAFAGLIEVPPGAGITRAEARIDAASLSLDGGPIEADVKAPHFLDVARHREILFSAAEPGMAASRLSGELTIRGVTLPVTLALARTDGTLTAEAWISRSAYGITARPVLAGDSVRIRLTAPLPP